MNNRRWRQLFDLLWGLVRRELKILYKRPALGMLWVVIVPLVQLLVFFVVFQLMLSIRLPRYSSFVFTGLIAWSWFRGTVGLSTSAIVRNRALILQPGFPSAVLPPVVMLSRLLEFLLALPILAAFLWWDGARTGPALLLVPILVLVQAILILSISYPLAALNVHFRDTQHVVVLVLNMLFFLSGVFYDIERLPDALRPLLNLNPMVHLIRGYRVILLEGAVPDLRALALVGVVSLALLPLGIAAFHRQSWRFAEEL